MTRHDPVMRPATPDDIVKFYGAPLPDRVRAYVADRDGAVLGLCGIVFQNGKAVAFSDIKPELHQHRRTLVKAAKIMNELINQVGGPVYAVANSDEPTAPYLLAKLGFAPTGAFAPSGEVLMRSA